MKKEITSILISISITLAFVTIISLFPKYIINFPEPQVVWSIFYHAVMIAVITGILSVISSLTGRDYFGYFISMICLEIKVPIVLNADAAGGRAKRTLDFGVKSYFTKPIKELFEITIKRIKSGKKQLYTNNNFSKSDFSKDNLKMKLQHLDVDSGLKRVADDLKTYITIINKFLKKNIGNIQIIKEFIDDENIDAAKPIIHNLKGTSGNISATRIYELCIIVESLFDEIPINKIEIFRLLDLIQIEMEKINEEVKLINEKSYKNTFNPGRVLNKEELLKKISLLSSAIEEFDSNALDIYEDIKDNNFLTLNEEFRVLGNLIIEYEFKEASKKLDEILALIKEGYYG